MSPADAFAIGFIRRCVHDGIPADQFLATVEKAAALLDAFAAQAVPTKAAFFKEAFPGEDIPGKAIQAVGNFATGWGVPALLAAPWIAGGAAGYGLGRMSDIDDTDIEEVNDKERIAEYQRQAAIARQALLAKTLTGRNQMRRDLATV